MNLDDANQDDINEGKMEMDEPRDESGYPGLQGLETIAKRKQEKEFQKDLENATKDMPLPRIQNLLTLYDKWGAERVNKEIARLLEAARTIVK